MSLRAPEKVRPPGKPSEGLDWRQASSVPPGRPIALSLDDVLAGEAAIVRDGLQTLGFFDEIVQTTLEQTRQVVSEDARSALARQGFEALHRVMTPREAHRLQGALVRQFAGMPVRMVPEFVAALAGTTAPVYVCPAMYVRILMPEDVIARERKLLATAPTGTMQAVSPHRDAWYLHCPNTINLWVAIGAVRPGNGMLIYPQAWGSEPAREKVRIDRSARLGVPVNFSLRPGDMLVFSGDQLHSSEVNITDETRYVLTARFTVGRPRYRHEAGWAAHYDLRMLSGPLRPFASMRSRLTAGYLRHAGRAVRHRLHRPADKADRACCAERQYRGE